MHLGTTTITNGGLSGRGERAACGLCIWMSETEGNSPGVEGVCTYVSREIRVADWH